MEYKILNEYSNEINGTCLRGDIEISYEKLVVLFGEPFDWDGYKTDGTWVLKFSDGLIATIYNWKNGKKYLGKYGKDIRDIYHWHIGGHKDQVVKRVHTLCKGE